MPETLTNKPILDPEILDALQLLKTDIFRSINCVKVGEIVSFDAAKKTAQIQILFKRQLFNDQIVDLPMLVDCPVFTVQGGGAALEMPIQAGDQCVVLFSDRNLDAWFKTGGSAVPFDARCHHLSDGIALIGVNSLVSTLSNYQTDRVRLFFGSAEISIKGGKVKIFNGTATLLTLLDGLIDVLKALTIQDGMSTLPLTTASIAALEAYKLQLAGLLE